MAYRRGEASKHRTFCHLPFDERCPIRALHQRGASVSAIAPQLQHDWSAEQVAGYLKRVGAVSVSFSWLYQRIRQDRAQGGSLYTSLRQRGKPRRCKASRGSAGRG